MEHYYIGVDVGGTKIAFGLFDKEHRLITRSRIPSDREIDGPKLSALLLRQCDLLLETASVPKAQLSGIGVAMPSYILQKEGRILKTSNLPNIRDFPMRDYLSCRTAAEVRLEMTETRRRWPNFTKVPDGALKICSTALSAPAAPAPLLSTATYSTALMGGPEKAGTPSSHREMGRTAGVKTEGALCPTFRAT